MLSSSYRYIVTGTLSLLGALLLTQCSDVGYREKNKPVVRLAKPAGKAHDGNGPSREYRTAYRHVMLGRENEKNAPQTALLHYLSAAEFAYGSDHPDGIRLYNHAVGQVADLVITHREIALPTVIRIPSNGKYPVGMIADVLPADCLKARGCRTLVKYDGIGAPLVVRRAKSATTGVDRELATPIGLSYPATALLEFPQGGPPVLKFYDPTVEPVVMFRGKKRLLSYDLTMPLAVSLEQGSPLWKDIMLKWFGVFMPMEFVDDMQLYMTRPFDPDKIPLVLVHGLKADPAIWHNVMNELNADPVIREKYQIFAFYYPTGLPLRVPSAALKKEINKLYARYRNAGKSDVGRKMVIIGHSLGGLLTSVQIRDIDKDLLSRVFSTPVSESQLNPDAMKEYRYLIRGPKPHFIQRAIFISTPHRGSRNASIYPVRMLANLVRIPKNLLFLKVPEASAALTDFGRSLFGPEKRENSLGILQAQSATLKVLCDSPVYDHIRYHSIMGDRGRGDTPNSTDGVVAYSSSHLDGARSELIVPSGHNAYEHPLAIKEITRILRLHLND